MSSELLKFLRNTVMALIPYNNQEASARMKNNKS